MKSHLLLTGDGRTRVDEFALLVVDRIVKVRQSGRDLRRCKVSKKAPGTKSQKMIILLWVSVLCSCLISAA